VSEDNIIIFPKTPYPRGDRTCTIPLQSYYAMQSLARHVRDMMTTQGINVTGPNANIYAQQIAALYDAYDYLIKVDQMSERMLRR